MKNLFILCLSFFYIGNACLGQIDSIAWKRYNSLNKGVNSQGWLTHIFNTSTNGYLEYNENDFQKMHQYGFDHVRLKVDFVHWMDLDSLNNPIYPYNTNDTILLYTDTAISYCLNNNLICVLDYYNWSWDTAMLNSNNYLQSAQILGTQWKKIANRYKNYHGDSLLYEIYNEPGGVDNTQMRIAFKTIIDSIRTVDTVHTIIVWGQVDDYNLLNDDNIILTLHFYEPHFFANQGKTFGANIFATDSVPFPYDSLSMPQQDPADTNKPYLVSLYGSYPNKGTVAYIEQWIQALKNHADSLGVPLYMGEFGCTNVSLEESMMNYLKAVRETFENNDLPWTLYNWKNKKSSFFSMFDCNGCNDTDSLFVDSTGYTILCALGLDSCSNISSINLDFDKKIIINIYPNPSSSIINIKANNIIKTIELYSITGELINNINTINSKEYKINTASLSSGIYFIRFIVLDEKDKVYKLIVE